jgi:Na+-transporting NADH:ubiquinone oxidoreductase subunit B
MFFQKWDNIVKSSKDEKSFLFTQKALISSLDTFLRRSPELTKSAPHIRDATDLKRIMSLVVFSLLPCTFFGIWNTGKNTYLSIGIQDVSFIAAFLEGSLHVLPLILLSYLSGGAVEVFFAQIRKHEVAEGFLVTGLLYPLVCPPTIPWWMFIVGIVFGISIGKELFGGTGMNIINPALFSRAFLFFAYPAAMSGDEVWIKKPFYENSIGENVPCFWTTIDYNQVSSFLKSDNMNAISGQTPLALSTHLSSSLTLENINTNINDVYKAKDMFLGFLPGSIGETSTLMCIVGAAILITTRVGSWRVMMGVLVGAFFAVMSFNLFGTSGLSDVSYKNHLIMGSFAFGTVFMATDPVSGPIHKISQIIYGFLIGVFCILIRTINPAFPEGMMMSIIFLNIFSPLIDYYVTQYLIKKRNKEIFNA